MRFRYVLSLCYATFFAAGQCCAQQPEIPEGTKVSCRLEQTISSATADTGQQVQLTVTEDVKVGDIVVIAQGASVVGTIVEAQEKRRMGRTGKLDFSIDKVRAIDGEYVPLRYTLNKKEGGSHAVSTGVITAGVAVLFWPAAPFVLLRKGKDAVINKGIVFEAYSDSKHTLKSASDKAPGSPGPAPALPMGGTATVTISSAEPGADIEVDGNFAGSTPTTQALPPGNHKITVKKGGRVWERTLQVNAGATINVMAAFE